MGGSVCVGAFLNSRFELADIFLGLCFESNNSISQQSNDRVGEGPPSSVTFAVEISRSD